jgi:hypothetical protein
MTPAEAAALLAVAAAFDNRKPDADAAQAWALALDDLRFIDCRDAIVAHYRLSTDWVMPAQVRAAVKRIRAKRIDEHPPLVPPPGLDVAGELAWLAAATKRVGDGEQVDSDAAYGDLVSGPDVNFRELLPSPNSGHTYITTHDDTQQARRHQETK